MPGINEVEAGIRVFCSPQLARKGGDDDLARGLDEGLVEMAGIRAAFRVGQSGVKMDERLSVLDADVSDEGGDFAVFGDFTGTVDLGLPIQGAQFGFDASSDARDRGGPDAFRGAKRGQGLNDAFA